MTDFDSRLCEIRPAATLGAVMGEWLVSAGIGDPSSDQAKHPSEVW